MKKRTYIIMLLLIVTMPFMIQANNLGDIDNDGKVGSSDYVLLRRYLLKTINFNKNQLNNADVNNDGLITSADYILIRKKIINKDKIDVNPTTTIIDTPNATVIPVSTPTIVPTKSATQNPTATATSKPTATATSKPTVTATIKPNTTSKPTATQKPTATPTPKPTATPTPKPTATSKPTASVTQKPTNTATSKPTASITQKPTSTIKQKKQGSIKFEKQKITTIVGLNVKNPINNIGNGKITFKSSNNNIVNVDNNGIIIIKNAGKATITATVSDTNEYEYSIKQVSYDIEANYNYISYSSVYIIDKTVNRRRAINSKEHFDMVTKIDYFTSIKTDIQPTKDGQFILCHDSGFTLNSNNRVITYDSKNNTKINTLTIEEAKLLKHENGDQVTDLKYFLQKCKENNKIAFITVRDNIIKANVNGKTVNLVPQLLELIEQYDMTDKTIINCFTYKVLKDIRSRNSEIMLSYVVNGTTENDTAFNNSVVDQAAELKNCIVSAYIFNNKANDSNIVLQELSSGGIFANTITYANKKNVPVFSAIANKKNIIELSNYGISGMQINSSVLTK